MLRWWRVIVVVWGGVAVIVRGEFAERKGKDCGEEWWYIKRRKMRGKAWLLDGCGKSKG